MNFNKVLRNIKNEKDLYLTALYLGLTGYGGLAIVDQIKKEYVTKRKIVSERKFLSSLSLAQILPGSTIISLVSYFSYLKAGLIGAVLGTFIYIFPTFAITTAFAAFYFSHSSLPIVYKILQGLNILLISLLINALISIGRSIFIREETLDYRSILIAAVSFYLYFFMNMGVIPLVVISGVLGVISYTFTGYFKQDKTDVSKTDAKNAFFTRKKAWILLVILILLLSLSLFIFSSPLWVLFSSFLKIGALAFGGGVAAIPLIESTFVKNLHYFTETQFWDGISISQITPGPIFIGAAFFGYKIAGLAGASVATLAMCIPSIILMILAGKVHDRINRSPYVRGVVRGFLAGFVGVIIGLIISQMQRSLINVPAVLLMLVTLLILLKVKNGFFISFAISILYSLI